MPLRTVKNFISVENSGKEVPKANVIVARAGGPLLPISSGSFGAPDSPRTPGHSSSSSDTEGPPQDGHIILAGKPMEHRFEEISLQGGEGKLNGKLAQVLARRKAKELEATERLESEHKAIMAAKEREHLQHLELLDSAHHRTVGHLENELDKLRSQLTTALTRWEAAEEESQTLRNDLEQEKKERNKVESELADLNAVLEAEMYE